MAKYLMLLHKDPRTAIDRDPAETAAVIERYRAWSQGLRSRGKVLLGEKLQDEGGFRLSRGGAEPIAAGASADMVGGLFLIDAADAAEAEAIGRSCPHLEGGWIELRPIHET